MNPHVRDLLAEVRRWRGPITLFVGWYQFGLSPPSRYLAKHGPRPLSLRSRGVLRERGGFGNFFVILRRRSDSTAHAPGAVPKTPGLRDKRVAESPVGQLELSAPVCDRGGGEVPLLTRLLRPPTIIPKPPLPSEVVPRDGI